MADLSQYQMSVYEDPDTGKVMPQYYLAGAGRMIPMEEQRRTAIQTKLLDNVAVGAGVTTTFSNNPIDMTGFNTLGLGCFASASHAFVFKASGSPDGTSTNMLGETIYNSTSTSWTKGGVGTAPLDYALVQITNNDTVSRNYTVYTRKMNL